MCIRDRVGTALADYKFPYMLHDDEGDNISIKNASYCELTAQYWVWKHIEADYYGFFHYRRYFSFSKEEFPTIHEPFIFDEVVFSDNKENNLKKICLTEEIMAPEISKYDFITSRISRSLTGETVYEQYKHSVGHHIEDLDTVVSIIREDYPEFVQAMEEYLSGTSIYCCNMFIMKKELFSGYCKWLFDILGKHEERRDISEYPPIDRRVSGYLAERLCGIYITYLYERGYKGNELQRVYFKNTDITMFPGVDGKMGYNERESGNPSISLKTICRGNGEVYVKIYVTNPLKEYNLIAISKKENGVNTLNTTSILKRKKEKDIWLLELPKIGGKLLVTLKLCDKWGNVFACLNKAINTTMAGVTSRINKLINKEEVYEVLNNEATLVPGNMKVNIKTVIPDLDGSYILQGIIEAVSYTHLYWGKNAYICKYK